MEDLEVHTVWLITEGSKHLLQPECPFTRQRKKRHVGTSGILEEDFNHTVQERARIMLEAGFHTPLRKKNNSSDKEDDNLIFTPNKDPLLAKIKKQLAQQEKDHISMMQTITSLTGV